MPRRAIDDSQHAAGGHKNANACTAKSVERQARGDIVMRILERPARACDRSAASRIRSVA
jgi:hypothetical protein